MAEIWIIDAAAMAWLAARNRPQSFGYHLLGLTQFRRMRWEGTFQDTSFEDVERRVWNRILRGCAAVLILAWMLIGAMLPLPLWATSVLAVMAALFLFVVIVRCSRTYRRITLPMYMTLCRMEGARWDPRKSASRWVKVSLGKGKVWIRLPKDWNATRIQIRQITMFVNSRLEGTWKVSEDTRRFLLTFTVEPGPEEIELPDIETLESMITDAVPDTLGDASGFESEGDDDDKPW